MQNKGIYIFLKCNNVTSASAISDIRDIRLRRSRHRSQCTLLGPRPRPGQTGQPSRPCWQLAGQRPSLEERRAPGTPSPGRGGRLRSLRNAQQLGRPIHRVTRIDHQLHRSSSSQSYLGGLTQVLGTVSSCRHCRLGLLKGKSSITKSKQMKRVYLLGRLSCLIGEDRFRLLAGLGSGRVLGVPGSLGLVGCLLG